MKQISNMVDLVGNKHYNIDIFSVLQWSENPGFKEVMSGKQRITSLLLVSREITRVSGDGPYGTFADVTLHQRL